VCRAAKHPAVQVKMAYYPILSLANFCIGVLRSFFFFFFIILVFSGWTSGLGPQVLFLDLDSDLGLVLGLPDSAELELELQG
jgi:hypothetical protein